MTLALVALGAPAWSEDIYSWTDSSGRVHYTNTAAAREEPAPAAAPPVAAEPVAADASEENPPAVPLTEDESAALSNSTSIRRTELERSLRTTERRMREIDGRLSRLESARRSQGAPAAAGTAGGVDLRSEEEKALAKEREELAQRAAEVRTAGAKLRQEVSAKLGGTPDWWVDVR